MTDNNPKKRLGDLKDPLQYIPSGPALTAIARVLRTGAEKYGHCNWRAEAISMSTYQGAILRHLFAWWGGEDRDPDSGEHHFAHLGANAFMLLDAMACHQLMDDRPVEGEVLK